MPELKVVGSDYRQISEIIFINDIPEQSLAVYKTQYGFYVVWFSQHFTEVAILVLHRRKSVQSR